MHPGDMAAWIGVGAGCLVGLAGGLYGTWRGIQKTRGPRERAFMVRASLACWAALAVFFALMWALPSPYRYGLWIPYGILLPLAIRFWNRTQQRIREEEARPRGADAGP